MSVDHRARHELHARLDEVLGPEHADTLMSYLPPVGWPDVARKRDLDAFAERMEAVISHELGGFRHGLGGLQGALAAQTRTLLLGMSGLFITAAGIAFAAAQLG